MKDRKVEWKPIYDKYKLFDIIQFHLRDSSGMATVGEGIITMMNLRGVQVEAENGSIFIKWQNVLKKR